MQMNHSIRVDRVLKIILIDDRFIDPDESWCNKIFLSIGQSETRFYLIGSGLLDRLLSAIAGINMSIHPGIIDPEFKVKLAKIPLIIGP